MKNLFIYYGFNDCFKNKSKFYSKYLRKNPIINITLTKYIESQI